jgi:hypothetical protein
LTAALQKVKKARDRTIKKSMGTKAKRFLRLVNKVDLTSPGQPFLLDNVYTVSGSLPPPVHAER